MKKILLSLGIILFPNFLHAEPQVQDVGATSSATITAVSVTTVPALAYSTGNIINDNVFGITISSTTNWGNYMAERIQIEFFNDTSTDVWISPNQSVSSMTADNYAFSPSSHTYGRRVAPGEAWAQSGKIKNWWVVCATTTQRAFLTTQEK